MNQIQRKVLYAIGLTWLLALSFPSVAQVNQIIVQMGQLEDAELSPANIFNFRVQNNAGGSRQATVTGTVQYRNSPLRFSYTFRTVLSTGLNMFSAERATGVQWSFSDNALRELFRDYSKLPAGTYEYCVEITTQKPGPEVIPEEPVDACTYHQVEDVFLISLVEPEDGERIREPYPVFNWVVNYPFASALTYRLRVAEQKPGQTAMAAVQRNNPVYSESRLLSTTQVYPVTAHPLEQWQWYAWTVDAYYKGLLLGGAETWRFMIVEDSVLKELPKSSVFVDIKQEQNTAVYYAVGEVKLKYVLEELMEDVLTITLKDKDGDVLKLKEQQLKAVLGDNRYQVDLKDQLHLKHLARYEMVLTNSRGASYRLMIRYVNPDFIN